MSYRESIGLAKEALYALRYVRMCARMVGDSLVELNWVGASRLYQYKHTHFRFADLYLLSIVCQ